MNTLNDDSKIYMQANKCDLTFGKISRRRVMAGGAASMTLLAMPSSIKAAAGLALQARSGSSPSRVSRTESNRFLTTDGTGLYFKDWGAGRTIVFCHGWPLSSDAWDAQMLFFGQHGFRVIAHDRRGHGRSEQPWHGNNIDQYADDLADLLKVLGLQDVILVGHSTGAGEAVRYIGRHGTKRLSKLVLISSITPLRLRTPSNPTGAPLSDFDGVRTAVVRDRSQFLKDLSLPFFGYNRSGAKSSQGVRDELWREGMQASIVATFDGIRTQSETDFSADLGKIDVPTILMHGEEDQLVPLRSSATLSSKLIRHSSLKVYPGAPHGLIVTHASQVNADLLSFVRAGS